MKAIGIIRDRGQLTIPDSIRRSVAWANPLSAVSISVVKPDEIILKPQQVQVKWDEIWENIRKSRAVKGSGSTSSAADFLQKDRASH